MKLTEKIVRTLILNYGFKYYPEDKYLIKQILKSSQDRHPKVLDVGCGNGHYSILFDKEGANVTGFDIDKTLIEKANKKKKEFNSNAVFLVCDGRFPNRCFSEKFDIIFMSGFSLFGQDLNTNKKIMKEYISLLNTRGKLVFISSSNLNGFVRSTGWKNHQIQELESYFKSLKCESKEIYFYDRHFILRVFHSFVFNNCSTKMHILITKITKLPCSLIIIVETTN